MTGVSEAPASGSLLSVQTRQRRQEEFRLSRGSGRRRVPGEAREEMEALSSVPRFPRGAAPNLRNPGERYFKAVFTKTKINARIMCDEQNTIVLEED